MTNTYKFILIIIFMLLATISYGQDIKSKLNIGQKLSANLNGGEANNYQLYANENSCIYVVVEQIGIDVEVNLYNSKNQKVFTVDSPNGTEGPEPVFYIAQEAGLYRLEVVSTDPKVSPGRYEVIFKETHTATKEDKGLIEANSLFDKTEALYIQKTDSSYKENYEKLLTAYQDLLKQYNTIFVEELFLPKLAQINLRLGQIDFSEEKYLESIEKYQKALILFKEDNPEAQGICLSNIGESLKALGNNEEALKYYLKALSFYDKGNSLKLKLVALNNTGSICDLLGNKKLSLDFYLKALNLAKSLDDQLIQATIYSNLGLVFEDLEEHQEAINYYQKSLDIFIKNNRIWEAGVVSSNIGAVYDDLGNYEKALQSYKIAITHFEEAKTLISKARTLVNIGSVYSNPENLNKNFQLAKNTYLEALTIFENKKDLRGTANVLTKLGALETITNPSTSIETLTKALQLRKDTSDFYGESYTHLMLGNAFTKTNKPSEAIEQYKESLKINRKIGDKRGESTTLYQLAKLQKQLNMLEDARKTIQEALDIVEFSRLNVNINNLRITYLARSQKFYELYINILMVLGEEALAFEISEKSRSRSLLENLSKVQDEYADPHLVARQRSQTLLLNQKIEKIVTLKKDGREKEIPIVETEIEKIKSDIDDIESKIRQTRPIEQTTKPLTLSFIQENVLDADTAAIEYSLGDDGSYAWVVTKNSIKSYTLPSRTILDELAGDAFRYLTIRENQTIFSDENDIKIGDKKYLEKSNELSALIITPLVENLSQHRLIFIPEGKLLKIPFSALPLKSKNITAPLLTRFEVTLLPSVSVLGIMRTRERIEHEKTIAIIADPVFNSSDSRLKNNRPSTSKDGIALKEKVIQRRGIEFERLPFTETEVTSIINSIPKNKIYNKYVGFDATLENVLKVITQYDILHFSSHAISENFHKGVSAIVLSLIDKNGNTIDGIFSSDVVSSLNLNLDLVVLAACDTARGKVFAGEGVIGLGRSFIYAGARSVIITGWEVNDEATAELMKRFYTEVFTNKVNYATALRRAQLSMLKNSKYSHPFYWAPFSFEGDYMVGK